MPKVELDGIRNFVCKGTNLKVRPGELLVLLGPNGAGKTTLLNVIAGLVPYKGTVRFDGSPMNAVPARFRKVGYVFQDLVLFPHLDVSSNIAYGLRSNGSPKYETDERVGELLKLLAISHLAARFPAKLSGGEKQRVALARALAPRPEILLLDEPFNSLDSQTGSFLRAELKHLQCDLGTTTVFVTHDLAEAEEVADRIAVVRDGLVEQIGTPQDVLFSPSGRKIGDCIGSPNILECQTARSLGHGLTEANCDGLQVLVPSNGKKISTVAVLPRDVLIHKYRPASGVNVFEGVILDSTPQAGSDSILAHVDTGGHRIAAELPKTLCESMRLQAGITVFVELDMTKIRTMPVSSFSGESL